MSEPMHGVQAFTEPFPHWILDGLLPAGMLAQAAEAIPPAGWAGWYRYDSAFEQRKRTCQHTALLPFSVGELMRLLNSPDWLRRLREITGAEELLPDPTLHGGGIHCTDPGGFLDVHIDYALHPALNLERRLNLIVFLNQQWREEWGGALEFWDDAASRPVAVIPPRFGRVVLWEPSDIAYHGMPDPLACPEGTCRVTAAVYYLCKPRSHVVRKRALFVPRRQTVKQEQHRA